MELTAEMAESIAHKMVLSMPLLQDLNVCKHFSTQFTGLKDDINYLRAKLVDSRHNNVEVDRVWFNQVRAALYDIQDLVDRIYVVASSSNRCSLFGVRISPFKGVLGYFLKDHWTARKMREVRKKLVYEVAGNTSPAATDLVRRSDIEETKSSVCATPLLERIADVNAVIRMLHHHPSSVDRLSVILIFGVPGLGKTTLAQLVFNDTRIPTTDLRFWVWVGNDLDQVSLISRISQSIKSEIVTGQSTTTVQDAIRRKRLLLVLDDVRLSLSEEELLNIKDLFVGSSSITVIITTRCNIIQNNYGQIPTQQYPLRAISNDDAWTLFENNALNIQKDPELQDLGWEMLRKTNNIPRVIKDLSSVLSGQDKSKWNILMKADFTSINEGYSPVVSASELTFRLLPSPLKRCFAYSALSQHKHNNEMQHLIHLWIAQAYITEEPLNDDNKSFDDIAEDYYKALQDWSFLKNSDSDLDLAMSVAASEMLFVQFNCAQEGYVTNIDPYDCEGIYHVFIRNTPTLTNNFGQTNANSNSLLRRWIDSLPSRLRSFLKVHGSTMRLTKSICNQLFTRLGHLRALDLNSSNITVVPASIGMLDQLRYLNLSLNDFIKLPSSITDLGKLQVLDLSSCKKLVKLPSKLSRLSSLRHLYLDGCDNLTGMPLGLCKMTALQTLNLFVLGKTQRCCKLDELRNLNLKPDLTYRFASPS